MPASSMVPRIYFKKFRKTMARLVYEQEIQEAPSMPLAQSALLRSTFSSGAAKSAIATQKKYDGCKTTALFAQSSV